MTEALDEGVPLEDRVAELESELAAAQRTIDVLVARLERVGTTSPSQTEVFDAAVRLGHVLEERTQEVEAARAEFRALRANLDQIVRQRTRALAESEAQLRTKNSELERSSHTRAEFISIAAHELRTPLTSIVGYLDLFQEGRFGELPAMIERPMSSVRRNALPAQAARRRDARGVAARGRPDDADARAGRSRRGGRRCRDRDAAARERARAARGHADRAARADRRRSRQAAPDRREPRVERGALHARGGDITIELDEAPRERYPGGWARLRVRDTGMGIAEEDRQQIFEPFRHASPAKHHTSAGPDSAGLGLYIARGLIELHGGLITVDSQVDVFSEFTVLLPFKNVNVAVAGSAP